MRTFFKEWREWRRWTQEELADRMGANKQLVSRVEGGSRDFGKFYLEAFGHAIGCHPAAPLLMSPSGGQAAERFAKVVELLSTLPESDVMSFVRMAEGLKRLDPQEQQEAHPAAKARRPGTPAKL